MKHCLSFLILLPLLFFGFLPQMKSQQGATPVAQQSACSQNIQTCCQNGIGCIQVTIKAQAFQSAYGMPDYENYDRTPGYEKPDLYYHIEPIHITINGNPRNSSDRRSWFFENEPSQTRHDNIGYHLIFRSFSGSELGSFNLSEKNTITASLEYWGNEDDRPFQEGFGGDDDYKFSVPRHNEPLTWLAPTGETLFDRQQSISGYTTAATGALIFPYFFTFQSSYTLDALHSTLEYRDGPSQNSRPLNVVCEGDPIYIRAKYKSPFYGGYFHWQKNEGSGWVDVGYYLTNTIQDVATIPATQYRARLMATASSYGVSGFGQGDEAVSDPNLLKVRRQIDDFTVEITDVCEGETYGKVRLTGLTGATDGKDYTVSLYDASGENAIDLPVEIINYSNNYLTENEIAFYPTTGSYRIGVFENNGTGLPCGIRKRFSIVNSAPPEFTAIWPDIVCLGDSAQVNFNAIQRKHPDPRFSLWYKLQAIASSGDTTSEVITQANGALTIAPGDNYRFLVENADACIAEQDSLIDIQEATALMASIPALPTVTINGTDYNGTCSYDLFDAQVNISGGTPPYQVFVDAPAGIQDRIRRLEMGENAIVIKNLQHGVYFFTISDAIGCTVDSIRFEVKNPSGLSFDDLSIANPNSICMGNGDGSISADVSGGFPPYVLTFGGTVVTDFDTTGLGNMTTVLKITDSLGCEQTRAITLQAPNSELLMSDRGLIPYEVIPCDGALEFVLYVDGGNMYFGNEYTFEMDGVDCAANPNCTRQFFYEGYYTLEPARAEYRIRISDNALHTFTVSDGPQNPANQCTISASYQFPQATIPEVTGINTFAASCGLDTFFYPTFYLSNLDELIPNSNERIFYELDGKMDSTFLGRDDAQAGSPIRNPYEATIRVGGAGQHSIVFTDKLGCSAAAYDFTLETVDPFLVNLNTTAVANCFNDSTGSIQVETQNGVGPYQYKIYAGGDNNIPATDSMLTGNSSHTFTNLPAAAYLLIVSDARNCEIRAYPNILPATPLQADISSSSNINCTGSNGVIEVTNISGGTPPYAYALNGGPLQSSATLNNALTNNTVLVADSNGCAIERTLAIPLAGPTLFSTISQYLPASDCAAGAAILTLQPGFTHPVVIRSIAGPAQYRADEIIVPGDSIVTAVYTDTLTSLSAGVHYFLIQDGLGCEKVDSVVISMAAPLTATINVNSKESCYQQSTDGSLTIVAAGGQPPYDFSIDGENYISSSDSVSFTGLPYGTYFITVRDQGGCFVNLIDSIIAGSLPGMDFTVSNYGGCVRENLTADISLSGKNGVAPYTFTWGDGTKANFRAALPINEYAITITDANGCTRLDVAYVLRLDTLQVSIKNTRDVNCQLDTDGQVMVSTSGGFPPYEFSKDGVNFQSDSTFNGLGIGTYEILVKDDHGCLDTTTATIIHTNVLAATTETTDVLCNGANDGTLRITVTNGLAPYAYSINGTDYQLQNNFENLAPGTYSAWVEDGSGCIFVEHDFIVAEPLALSVNTSQVFAEICGQNNGLANGSASGGTTPYTYQWDNDPSLTDMSLSNAGAGSHTLLVTDANGCTSSSSLTIDAIPGPTVIVENKQDEVCGQADGLIDLNVVDGTPPFTFTWSHFAGLNDSLASGLQTGTYTVTITDANNCSASVTTDLANIAGPALSVFSTKNSTCSDDNGEIVLANTAGTAPFSYLWSHNPALNNNTASGLAGGTYTVTITDNNGCTGVISAAINFEASPEISAPTVTQATCGMANGSIAVSIANGQAPYTYAWSHDPMLNTNQINNLPGGTYGLTVTDANSCTDVTSILVSNSSIPQLSIANFSNADCLSAQGSITLQTTSGQAPYTYSWSHDPMLNDSIATGLSSGTYTAVITDANDCQDTIVQSLISFIGNSEVTETLKCAGDTTGAILITLEGDINTYDYNWSKPGVPNGPEATNLGAGIYTVTVTNNNGCTEVFSEEILSPDQLVANITEIIPVGCDGNLGRATVTANGGTGAYTYRWNDALSQTTATANDLSNGNYEVLVFDENGCLSVAQVTIEASADLVLSEAYQLMPPCFGGQNGQLAVAVMGGVPPYTYLWNDAQVQTTDTAVNLVAGTYTLTVTDAVACTQTIALTLDEPAPLMADLSVIQSVTCFGDQDGQARVEVSGGTTPYTYAWDDPNNQSTAVASDLSAGNYQVTVTDGNGCSGIEQIAIAEPAQLEITEAIVHPQTCTSAADGRIGLRAQGGTGTLTFNWSNTGTTASQDQLISGLYFLALNDSLGCTLLDTFEILNSIGDEIDLGASDTTLCNGATLRYDFSDTDFTLFDWQSLSNGNLGEAPIFETTGADTYYLEAERTDGCVVKDTITIEYTGQYLDAFFIAPTDIVLGDTIVALELSQPIPDTITWSFDTTAVLWTGKTGNQFLFNFTEIGAQDLTLTAFHQGCSNSITKTIFVYADSADIPFVNPLVPKIVNLTLFPNPNDGEFTLKVELSEPMDMAIDIFNSQNQLFDRAIFTGGALYVKRYGLDLTSGIYYAMIQVDGVRKVLTFVVE